MKPWYKSRTVWFNLAAAVVVAVQVWFGTLPVSPEIQAVVVAAANLVLRFLTTKPVSTP